MSEVLVESEVEVREAPPLTPMLRHIVDKGDWQAKGFLGDAPPNPQQTTLCGKPWDRLGVSAGPLCDACRTEYVRRHPGWPLPGGAR